MADELKPCPFCGDDNAYIYEVPHHYFKEVAYGAACLKCLAMIGHRELREEAVAAWNRRAEDLMLTAYRSLAAKARHRDYPDQDPCEAFRAVDAEAWKIAALLEKKESPQR